MPSGQWSSHQLSESIELPFQPLPFDTNPSGAMPIEPPDTASLTAMPELHCPAVVPNDEDWREHPRWKPLISTPSRSSVQADLLVPDPSPQKCLADDDSSVPGTPEGSFIHRRRRAAYVPRPPVWNIRPTTPLPISNCTSDSLSSLGLPFPNLADAVFREQMELMAQQWSQEPMFVAALQVAQEYLDTDRPLPGVEGAQDGVPKDRDDETPRSGEGTSAPVFQQQNQPAQPTAPMQAVPGLTPPTKREKISNSIKNFFTLAKGKKKRETTQTLEAPHDIITNTASVAVTTESSGPTEPHVEGTYTPPREPHPQSITNNDHPKSDIPVSVAPVTVATISNVPVSDVPICHLDSHNVYRKVAQEDVGDLSAVQAARTVSNPGKEKPNLGVITTSFEPNNTSKENKSDERRRRMRKSLQDSFSSTLSRIKRRSGRVSASSTHRASHFTELSEDRLAQGIMARAVDSAVVLASAPATQMIMANAVDSAVVTTYAPAAPAA